jgi:SNF2 family DNA or RNA helicase
MHSQNPVLKFKDLFSFSLEDIFQRYYNGVNLGRVNHHLHTLTKNTEIKFYRQNENEWVLLLDFYQKSVGAIVKRDGQIFSVKTDERMADEYKCMMIALLWYLFKQPNKYTICQSVNSKQIREVLLHQFAPDKNARFLKTILQQDKEKFSENRTITGKVETIEILFSRIKKHELTASRFELNELAYRTRKLVHFRLDHEAKYYQQLTNRVFELFSQTYFLFNNNVAVSLLELSGHHFSQLLDVDIIEKIQKYPWQNTISIFELIKSLEDFRELILSSKSIMYLENVLVGDHHQYQVTIPLKVECHKFKDSFELLIDVSKLPIVSIDLRLRPLFTERLEISSELVNEFNFEQIYDEKKNTVHRFCVSHLEKLISRYFHHLAFKEREINKNVYRWQEKISATNEQNFFQLLQIILLEGIDHQILGLRKLSADSFKLSAHAKLENLEEFQIKVNYEQVSNLNVDHVFGIIALAEGIHGYSSSSHLELASRNPKKRKNDLKFLKHRGAAVILMAEALAFRDLCKAHKMSKKELALKKQQIKERLKKIVFAQEEVELGTRVNQVIDLILEAFQKVNSEINVYLICRDQIFSHDLSLVAQKCQELINIVLTQGLAPEEFFKANPKFTIFEPLTMGFKNIFSTLTAVLPPEDIYINGLPLKEALAQDLETKIDVHERNDKIDWFDLHPKVFFKGKELSIEEIQNINKSALILHQGTYYLIKKSLLPKVEWLEFFWQQIQGETVKKLNQKNESKIVHQEKNEVLNLLAMEKKGIEVNGGPLWQEIQDNFKKLESKSTYHFFKDHEGCLLKEYQKYGVEWLLRLYHLKLGGILADDMGLGKTIQAILFLDELNRTNCLGRVLILMPTSLIYNWEAEFKKFAPHLPLLSITSKPGHDIVSKIEESKGLVILTTYGIIQHNEDYFSNLSFNCAIFDEAQNLKNILSKRTSIVRQITASFKIALTGTPLENNLIELFSLIDLVLPGALGDLQKFTKTYSIKNFAPEEIAKKVEFLRLKIAPIVLRRLKKNILSELPEKTETEIYLPFAPIQKKIYKDVAVSWNNTISKTIEESGALSSQIKMLTALLRLRQICSHPAAVPGVSYLDVPPKIEQLLSQVLEIYASGESVLIFTNFLSTLNYAHQFFIENKMKSLLISGAVKASDRAKIIADFNTEGPCILNMTVKTGGVGLNLTKAQYVFHLEPWWNPQVENQATDRAHRMGQKNHVQVYRYIMKDSVEEKIQELKFRKNNIFNAVFSESESDLKDIKFNNHNLTKEDFDFLIS